MTTKRARSPDTAVAGAVPNTRAGSLLPYWLLGLVVRVVAWGSSATTTYWRGRVEVSTPFNSFQRLQEGLFLLRHGMDPFDGGVYHQAPLLLTLFHLIPEPLYPAFFLLVDLAIAALLVRLARWHADQSHVRSDWLRPQFLPARTEEEEVEDTGSKEPEHPMGRETSATAKGKEAVPSTILLPADALLEAPESNAPAPGSFQPSPEAVGLFYFLHPFSILPCIAQSTTPITGLCILCAIYAAAQGQRGWSMLGVAAATYLSLAPIGLLAPCILLLQQASPTPGKAKPLAALALFVVFVGLLLLLSAQVMGGSYAFLQATYGARYRIADLTPNIGLFWYFFTEIFEDFRAFFLGIFHLLLYVFVVPLTIRLRTDPLFLAYFLTALISVFQGYPSVADVALYLSLLLLHAPLFPYMRHTFLVVNSLCYATILGPLFFDLWIYAGSGNANFFYAITLVFGLAQIFLMLDSLFAWIKWDWDRRTPGWRTLGVELGQ